jgi:hypothetical protein
VLLVTAAWQYVAAAGFSAAAQGEWSGSLSLMQGAAAVLAVTALLAALAPRGRLALVGFGVGLVSLLVLPATWALSSVVVASHVEFPAAGLWQPTAAEDPVVRRARAQQIEELLTFLRENRHGERFLAATPDARRAAPLIIASGEPVMAMGGYMGADAIVTPEVLAQMVARRELRFVMIVPEDEPDRRAGRNIALTDWVRQNGKLVDPELWRVAGYRPTSADLPAPTRRGNLRHSPRSLASLELYDLAPPDNASTTLDH